MIQEDYLSRWRWRFLLPLLIFMIAWNVIPLLWVLGMSFYRLNLVSGMSPRFLGLENYKSLLNDPYFWDRFQITFSYVLIAVALEIVIGFALGFLFNSQDVMGKKIMLPILFAPMMIAPVASGVFFRFMYDPYWGVINHFLNGVFGFTIQFLEESKWAFPAVVAVDVWMWSPFMALMCIAGLQAVPSYLLEAAEIDRVSWWTKFRYVILPAMSPVFVLGALLRTIDAFKTFDTIFVMTGGGPGSSTELLSLSLYRMAFLFFNTGKASSLAIVMLFISIAFTSIYLMLIPKSEVRGR